MSTRYSIRHRTEYRYAEPVSASYGQLHLLPRDLAGQRCETATLTVTPEPERVTHRVDFFENRVSRFVVHEPHTTLTVLACSTVVVEDRLAELTLFGERPWESVPAALAAGRVDPAIVQYRLDSTAVTAAPGYRDYARDCFEPGGGLFEAIAALTAKIHREFAYTPGATSVTTPLAEVFATRRGVCQDLAHVEIACLRAMGLPARYVSGYLETDPPPGRPKLTGVDGSHAWVSVYVPDAGWVAVDPTNDQFVNGRYITAAIGRDYHDVPPMQGVIYCDGATEALEVSVDVVALTPPVL